jgi:hypothetical protein
MGATVTVGASEIATERRSGATDGIRSALVFRSPALCGTLGPSSPYAIFNSVHVGAVFRLLFAHQDQKPQSHYDRDVGQIE